MIEKNQLFGETEKLSSLEIHKNAVDVQYVG